MRKQNLEKKYMSLSINQWRSPPQYVKQVLKQRNKELWNRTVMALTQHNKYTPSAPLSLANYQPAGIEFNFKFVSVRCMLVALQLAADENDFNNTMAPITCQLSDAQHDQNHFNGDDCILTVFTKQAEGCCKVWYDVCDVWHAMYPTATSKKDKEAMLMDCGTNSCIWPDFFNGKYPSVQFIELFDMQTEKLTYRAVMTADDVYKFIMSACIRNKSDFCSFVVQNDQTNASMHDEASIELSVKRRLDAGEDLMSVANDSNCFGFVAKHFTFLEQYVEHNHKCLHRQKKRKLT